MSPPHLPEEFAYLRECPSDPLAPIESHARTSPGRPALILNNGTVLTRAQLVDAVNGIAARFAAGGLSRGDLVAIETRDRSYDLVLLLALGRLGCPVVARAGDAALALGAKATIVSGEDFPKTPVAIQFSESWVTASASVPPPSPSGFASPDDVMIYTLSSGSTGKAKVISCSLRRLHGIVSNALAASGTEAAESPCAIRVSAETLWFVRQAFTILWTGGTVFALNDYAARVAGIGYFNVTHIACSVQQLVGFMGIAERNPAAFAKIKRLTTGGGRLSPAVADSVRANMARRVVIEYGSSETGLIATGEAEVLRTEDSAVGHVVSGVSVEVVDDNDKSVTTGGEGTIRVRSATMIDSYADGGALGAIRDGWFYTGDRGAIDSTGLLRVYGRTGDMINAGGDKIEFTQVEENIGKFAGVSDVALARVPSRGVYAAVVTHGNFSESAFIAHVRLNHRLWSWMHEIDGVVKLETVPRGENGKIQRQTVAEQIAERLQGDAGKHSWQNGAAVLRRDDMERASSLIDVLASRGS
jgi:long-chain acyl-CoA synthetase